MQKARGEFGFEEIILVMITTYVSETLFSIYQSSLYSLQIICLSYFLAFRSCETFFLHKRGSMVVVPETQSISCLRRWIICPEERGWE